MVLLSAGLRCVRGLLVCTQRTKAAAYASEFEKGLFMSVLFLEYPKCSTCKKAKKWLANGAQPTEMVGKILKAAGVEK